MAVENATTNIAANTKVQIHKFSNLPVVQITGLNFAVKTVVLLKFVTLKFCIGRIPASVILILNLGPML